MLEDDDWPDWVHDGFNWMDNRRYRLGSDFMWAAEWWTTIERAYNWETSVSCFLSDITEYQRAKARKRLKDIV